MYSMCTNKKQHACVSLESLTCCHVIVARSFTLQEETLIWLIVSGIKILSEAQQHSLDNVGICLDTVTLCSLNWGQKSSGHSRQWILPLYSVIGCSTSVRIDDSSRFFVYRAGHSLLRIGFQNELYSNAWLFVFLKDHFARKLMWETESSLFSGIYFTSN